MFPPAFSRSLEPLAWLSPIEAALATILVIVAAALIGAIWIFVSKLHRRTEELRQREEQYRGMFEASTDGLIILSPSGEVVDANPAVCQMHGYPREQFLALQPQKLIHPASLPLFHQFVEKINQGECFQCEAQDIRQDGSVFDVEVHGAPFHYRGQFHLLGIVRDISARKETEREFQALHEELERRVEKRTQQLQTATEELRQNAAHTRQIIDHAHDAFIAMDDEGRVIDWNPQAEQTFGWTREEAIGQLAAQLVLPARQHEKHFRDLAVFRETGVSGLFDRRVEIIGKHKNGVEFPLEMTVSSVEFGECKQLNAFLHDISRRKASERALKTSNNLYSSLVENLPIYVLRKDRQGRVTYGNTAYYNLLGMKPEEVLGKTDLDLFPRELAEKYRRDDEQVMRTGEVFVDVEENRMGSRRFFFEVRKVPVVEHGEVTGVQAIFWDVTDRKLAQEEMQKARESAEKANRAKSEFLANMSHEMRTPLNAIIGFTQLLLETDLDPLQREQLTAIQDSGDTLLLLINDVLDVSKIEARKLELQPSWFDLREELGDTMKTLMPRAHSKHVELAMHIIPEAPSQLRGDSVRLRQVVTNLVGNAIKFTEQGEVLLDVGFDPDDENSTAALPVEAATSTEQPAEENVVLHFSVRDTGIGIKHEDLNRIFSAFEQADNSLARRYGGAGLGLAISAELVGLMGGRIWAESEVGHGSVFHFSARFAVPKTGLGQQQVANESQAQLANTHTLVLDDNATNRMIVDEMLRARGLRPALAENVEEAIRQMLQAHDQGGPFDLVLTDIHMPEVDGFTFVQRIREIDKLAASKVIALTSGPRADDTRRCRELGISTILTKPIKQSELFEAIAAALGLQAHLPPQPSRVPLSPPVSPQRILLAEDSEMNQKLAIAVLGKWGHQVELAVNGQEAVEAAASQPFDLVLMDVQMPIKDGLSATREIRQLEQQGNLPGDTARPLPIMAMTAHALAGDREKCLEAGMNGYVTKPVQQAELYQAIAEMVKGATHPVRNPLHEDKTVNEKANSDNPECINWSVALEAAGGDHELLAIIAGSAMKELPDKLQQLRQAISDGDAKVAHLAAHTIKGVLRTFESLPARDLAEELEDQAREKDLSGAAEKCDLLEQRLAPVLQSLKKLVDEGTMA